MKDVLNKLIIDGKLGTFRNLSGGLTIFNPIRANDTDVTFSRLFEKVVQECQAIDCSKN